jgi:hypothetical protein
MLNTYYDYAEDDYLQLNQQDTYQKMLKLRSIA